MNRAVSVIVGVFLCLFCFFQASLACGAPIRNWQLCGPFSSASLLDGVTSSDGEVSPEEPVDGQPWRWFSGADGIINLEADDAFGLVNDAVGFAYAEIEASESADAVLALGSDDALMAWWNGRQVLVHDVLRGLEPGEDEVMVRVRKGVNKLLLKVYDAGGGFGMAAELRPLKGAAWKWEEVVPLRDDALLDKIEKAAFEFFWEEIDPDTGLMADSAPRPGGSKGPCSVASMGFGLSAYCIAAERGWKPYGEVVARVRNVLRFMLEDADEERGFFYHFMEMENGKRSGDSELSSIDTALFLAGALTCREYFNDEQITALTDALYKRVDWRWMLAGDETLSMGWRPESGFIEARWDAYSEHMILYLLAIGAPSNALSAEAWHAWKRNYYTYNDRTYVQAVPLFLHQYSHCWVDFRHMRDAYADYFLNSRLATLSHRDYCISLSDRFPAYSSNLWGVTASKGPQGYEVWGGPPPTLEHPMDGTVVPCAAGGSLPFAPDATLPVLRRLYEEYKQATWHAYGLIDAFNPNTGWVADGYIGIDLGATVLMIENLRTGDHWRWFMRAPEIESALQTAGFVRTDAGLDKADRKYLRDLAEATWDCIAHFVHPETQLPYDSSNKAEHTSVSNIGMYLASLAAAKEMGFLSETGALDRASMLLESIESLPAWEGFIRCWHGVADLKPSPHDPWMSVVDSGNLCMGLAVAAEAFPSLAERFNALLQQRNWSALYNVNADQLYGGYDMEKGRLNPDWRIDTLATDSRGAAFMAIVAGAAPPSLWNALGREMTERHHVRYLKPGWVGGGLFMQYLTGIFLDEKNSLIGRSAANLAYANMQQARAEDLPVWGWSSCLDPAGGYIGWGVLRDEVVTPHASVLAIEEYPNEVFANLLRLQQMGARKPWTTEEGEQRDFGFRDSINIRTGQVSDDYLVFDQAMLFLSLVNYLEDGLVRRWFHSRDDVRAAFASISELSEPEGGPRVSVYEPGLGSMKLREQTLREAEIARAPDNVTMDGRLDEWDGDEWQVAVYPEHAESGVPPNKERFALTWQAGWDEEYLYVAAKVREDELVCEQPAKELYKDDAMEVFVDPAGDGFYWGNTADFQIGISPSGPGGDPQAYAWFQDRVPDLLLASSVETSETGDGVTYTIETAIPWNFLGITDAGAGKTFNASVAAHTVDRARKSSAKINWSYVTDIDHIRLGRWTLAE